MKTTLALALLFLFACSSHSKPDDILEVSGYPVYKFLNFGEINANALTKNEGTAREILGEQYDAYVEQHQLFVSHGFDLHFPLTVVADSGDEITIYVADEDYKKLWVVSPHDLSEQKRSHRVSLKYIQVRVGEDMVNRAVSFEAVMIDREPILKK